MALLSAMATVVFLAAACANPVDLATSDVVYEPVSCLRPTCEEVPVKRGDVNVTVSASGSLRYANKADLSFLAAGKVAGVEVGAGDIVVSGKVLARLDPVSLELDLVEARAALLQAEAALEDLLAPPTSEDIIRAEAAASNADDAVTAAQAALEAILAGATDQELAQARVDVVIAKAALREAEQELEAVKSGPSASDIAKAEVDVANVELAFHTAEVTLADLEGDVDPLELKGLEATLAQARSELEETQNDLTVLEAGPDPKVLDDKQKELDLAKIELLRAELELDAVSFGSNDEIDLAEAVVARAALDVDLALAEFDLVVAGPTDGELNDALLAVALAEIAVADAESALSEAVDGPTDHRLAQARAALDTSKLQLALARERRAVLEQDTDTLEVRAKENEVALVATNLDAARQHLSNLTAGPELEALIAARTDVRRALDDLADATEHLAQLREGPSEIEVELTRAKVLAARIQLDDASWARDHLEIIAPFDGLVSAVSVFQGQTAKADDVAVQLVDTTALEMEALVNEVDIGRVTKGQSVAITIKALPAAEILGQVTGISTVASGETQEKGVSLQAGQAFYEVIIAGQSDQLADLKLLEGMTASAKILIARRPGTLFVPVGAMIGENGGSSVQVVDGLTVSLVIVTPGLRNGRVVEILEGVKEGEVVRVNRSAGGILGGN